jgi:hypothetical protein
MRKAGTPYYLSQDHLGGTALVTDANAAMVGRVRYNPYGMIRDEEGTLPTDKLFTGQQQIARDNSYWGTRIGNWAASQTKRRLPCWKAEVKYMTSAALGGAFELLAANRGTPLPNWIRGLGWADTGRLLLDVRRTCRAVLW